MAAGNTRTLPDYENPPVDEVVCGLQFEPLKLLVPHFGLLWEKKFREEYPGCQEVTPLMAVLERFDEPSIQQIETSELPLPRVWFTHEDGRIIQVQRDRFLHNWRKLKPSDEYPHYEKVYSLFQKHLTTFFEFLRESDLGQVSPIQYEMTYVNLIPQGEGWETLSDLGKVFPDFSWRAEQQRFLPNPDSIDWRTSFPLPNRAGRLRMHLQTAVRRSDKKRLFRFELTARGMKDSSFEKMQEWFDLAHEWIVCGFADSTGRQIQHDVWRLKR